MDQFILKPPAWPSLTVQTSSEAALNAPALKGQAGSGYGPSCQLWAEIAEFWLVCCPLYHIQL